MSGFTSFAIWGAGHLGGRLATQFLEHRPEMVTDVIILTRPESKENMRNHELASKGAVIRPFDVHDVDAYTALRDIDVLISSPAFGALFLQHDLIRAAVKAGVKLFVPGEWGDTTDGRKESIFQLKQTIRLEAQKLGLPTTTFFTGVWTEWLQYLGFDFKEGSITINGAGDAQVSMPSIDDVVRFAAHVLLRLPRERLENAQFTLEGDKTTLNRLAAAIQLRSPKIFNITHIPRRDLEKKLQNDPDDIYTSIFLGWDLGKGEHPNNPSNEIWPEWKPRAALEVLQPLMNPLGTSSGR